MNKKEIVKIIMELRIAYPYYFKDLDDEMIKGMISLYEEHFKDYTYEQVKKSIYKITSKNEYMPSIAEIKKNIVNEKFKDFPDAEDEWNLVIDLVHKYGSYNVDKAMNEMKPYTRYITHLVGFVNICMANDQTWNKKNFIEEYNIMKDRDLEYLQIGENAKKIENIELLDLKDA